MNKNRYLLIILFAISAVAVVLLYFRFLVINERPSITLLRDDAFKSSVSWPSVPSARPLITEVTSVVAEPAEPNAAQIFKSINEYRQSIGLKNILLDDTLTSVAQLHVEDMSRRKYFSHETPEGVTFEMRINASGYSYITAEENLGFASHATLIVPDWMRSSPHRANIENENIRRIGVATSLGKWQGIDVIYAVAVFAEPR